MECTGVGVACDNTVDVTLNDLARPALKAENKFVNALQMRCSRGRAAFNMLSWRERKRSIDSGIVTPRVLMGWRTDGWFVLGKFQAGKRFQHALAERTQVQDTVVHDTNLPALHTKSSCRSIAGGIVTAKCLNVGR